MFAVKTEQWRVVRLIAVVIALLAFGGFVWPTPWKEYKSGSQNLRVNRFTGHTQVLNVTGWHDETPARFP